MDSRFWGRSVPFPRRKYQLERELKNIINPTGMSMTDKERLDLIERVYREMRHYRTLVNYYTRKNLRVSYLRAREKGETEQVLKLYGEDERYW